MDLLREASPTIARVVNEAIHPSTPPPPEREALQPDRVRNSAGCALDQLLTEKDRRLSEILAAGFLGDGEDEPTAQIAAERANRLQGALTSELAEQALAAAVARPWTEISLWAAVGTTDVAAATNKLTTADLLVEKLWAERAQGPSAPDDFRAALSSVRELTAGFEQAREDLTSSLLSPVFEQASPDETNVNRLDSEFSNVQRFLDADLLDAGVAGNILATAMRSALDADLPPTRPGRPPTSSEVQQQWIDDWAGWVAERAVGPTNATLLDSILSSNWIPSPRKEVIALRVASASELPCPLNLDRIAELIEQHPTDPRLAELLKWWLMHYPVEPDEVHAIAEPYLDGDLPDAVQAAVTAWAAQASRSQRTEAVLPVLSSLPAQRPSEPYLDATKASDADLQRLADEIVQQCQHNGRWNPEQRTNVLETWRQLSVQEPKARATLLKGVAVAFLEKSGYTAAIELLDYQDLLSKPPTDVREEVRSAFRMATAGRPREKAVRDMVDKAGIDRKPILEKATEWLTGSR